jgi:hypothetical protein
VPTIIPATSTGADAVARLRARSGDEHERQVAEHRRRRRHQHGPHRVSDASRSAATFAMPCDCSVFANWTIKMPFFAIKPTSVINPTCE